MKRSRRRKQHLIQMRGQPDAGRVLHRIEGAAFLVREGLHPAQEEQRGSRRTAPRESGRGDGAVGRDVDLLDIRMHRRRGIHGIEERLAQAVGRARTGEAFVQQARDDREPPASSSASVG